VPIENERKLVLRDPDGALERALAGACPPWTRYDIRQAYLDAPGLRIRRFETAQGAQHIFSFKRPVGAEMVEIETPISAVDFDRLWTLRRETLEKARFHLAAGDCGWDVDFFKSGGRTYFALAEVEMPEGRTDLPATPAIIAPHVVMLVPPDDQRFASKKLADTSHAARLARDLLPPDGA
jgi:CYTH domain-containing protein